MQYSGWDRNFFLFGTGFDFFNIRGGFRNIVFFIFHDFVIRFFRYGHGGDLLFRQITVVSDFGHIFTADEKTSGFRGSDRELHQIYLSGRDIAFGIFFAPEIYCIGTRSEKFQLASWGAESILFFQNESADSGTFTIIFSAFGFFVDDAELSFRIIFAEIVKFADKKFSGDHGDNFVRAIFFHAQQTVIFVADDHIIAFYRSTHIAGFSFPTDFDIVQCGSFAVDLFDIFDFGTAGEVCTIFLFDFSKHIDGIVDKM